MIGKGFQENVAIDEGVNKAGVRTIYRWEGDELITQQQQDMEPVLEYVRQQREALAGAAWGEGRAVGHIPELYYPQIVAIKDRAERGKAIKQFFVDHPEFCYYPAYLKQ